VQKKVVNLLHFALSEEGYLFLGPSETIGRQTELFELISKKWRIFRRIGPSRPERVEFPIVTRAEQPDQVALPAEPGRERPVKFAELTQRLVLEELGTTAVLINRKYEILYYLGPTGRYLEQPTGEPTRDLMILAREGLRTKLRAAVHKALRENQPVVLTDVHVKRNGNYRPVAVTVKPVPTPRSAEGLLLITFQDQPETVPSPPVPASEESLVRHLENELRATKEDLQTTVEEVESSNEELKASNEEVMSMNEELQSANEELETSKEELQSLNEELTTVNNQLQEKVTELETANNDMANLLNCTDVATVFLDSEFRIKRFTPAATQLFHFVASDLGRPVGDLTPRFNDPELLDDAQQVLQQLAPREKEISTADGSWWVRRIMPYRTRDNRIDGVVITFVDITERKRAADAVVRRLAAIVESSVDAIFSKDLDGTIRTWNRGAERLYRYTSGEAIGQSVKLIVPEDRAEEFATIMAQLRCGESVEQLETERVCKDGRRLPVALTVSSVRDSSGKVVSASVIARDISERKRAEQELRDREEHLQAILNTAVDAIITIDQRGIIQSVNPAAEQMFGYAASEMVGQNVKMLMPAPYHEEHDRYLADYLRTGVKKIIGIGREVLARRDDGSTFPVDLAVSEIPHLKLFTGMIRDISLRKELEREVVEVASLQQRRIGRDLHDTVGQELTALNLLAADLAETLRTNPANGAALVGRIVEGLRRSQGHLRTTLRGLLPVAVEREGLMDALADLADRIQKESKVICTFTCPKPVHVADVLTATNLYLIAQEAVHNALKHSQARNIRISLESNQLLVLRVQDDGLGIPAQPAQYQGLGLRIMRNRAGIIGARLTIEPVEPTGTLVTCALARIRNDQEQDLETSQDSDRR
jgi:two-component system CheB/CheR fusion protein